MYAGIDINDTDGIAEVDLLGKATGTNDVAGAAIKDNLVAFFVVNIIAVLVGFVDNVGFVGWVFLTIVNTVIILIRVTFGIDEIGSDFK